LKSSQEAVREREFSEVDLELKHGSIGLNFRLATIDEPGDDSVEQTTSSLHPEITIICPTTRQPNENNARRPPFNSKTLFPRLQKSSNPLH